MNNSQKWSRNTGLKRMIEKKTEKKKDLLQQPLSIFRLLTIYGHFENPLMPKRSLCSTSNTSKSEPTSTASTASTSSTINNLWYSLSLPYHCKSFYSFADLVVRIIYGAPTFPLGCPPPLPASTTNNNIWNNNSNSNNNNNLIFLTFIFSFTFFFINNLEKIYHNQLD